MQLASGAKSFRANPLLGSAWLNRRGLHAARVLLARMMAERRRQRLAGYVGAGEIADYMRDGFVVRRNFLPPALFEAVRRDLDAHPLPSWERREGQPSRGGPASTGQTSRAVRRLPPFSTTAGFSI